MALSKVKLGELVSIIDERNSYGIRDFFGININKEFMPTVADTTNLDETKYKIVRKNRFVFSGMQTGRDECIRISMYLGDKPIIVSPAYTTFEVVATDLVLPEYFFMLFLSKEKDRLGWFYSDSSIRSNLDWDRFCDIDIELPSLEVQQKYVNVYLAMLANQRAYEKRLDDLKLVCDAYIEDLRRKMPCEEIGVFLKETRQKNDNGLALKNRAVSNSKIFVDAKEAVFSGVETRNYLIVNKEDFAYNTVTTRNTDKLSIALNKDDKCLVSPLYTTFKIIDKQQLLPEYLMLWFLRDEYDREARYKSWGSARELFSFDILAETKIPIPSIEVQKSIAELYKVYNQRKEINEKLKAQIKNLCPILIRGAINS